MKKIVLALTIQTLFFQSFAFGWGQTGHRVTGEIAQRYLTPEAQEKLKALMGKETLARSSTWADEVRSNKNKKYYDRFLTWHYVEIPLGLTYEKSKKNPAGDVVKAIQEQTARLKNKKIPQDERIEAVRLLVHFVGDIHMPLHVGNGEDRGGNQCQVKFFGEDTNLHRVWDESLIRSSELSYSELVDFVDRHTSEEILGWQKSNVTDWVNETAMLRPSVYPTPHGDRPYCTAEKGKIRNIPDLGFDYRYEHLGTVELQLFKGGVRLAALLNESL